GEGKQSGHWPSMPVKSPLRLNTEFVSAREHLSERNWRNEETVKRYAEQRGDNPQAGSDSREKECENQSDNEENHRMVRHCQQRPCQPASANLCSRQTVREFQCQRNAE